MTVDEHDGESPEASQTTSLEEKLDEHSKQLELSTEKLSQLQSKNTALRDQNQTLNVAGNKKRRFNTRVQPMGNLNTPSTREGTTDTPPASGVAGATRERTENPQVHDLEESDSEPEPGKEEPEKGATESFITANLEQMFSRRFDAMQSMQRDSREIQRSCTSLTTSLRSGDPCHIRRLRDHPEGEDQGLIAISEKTSDPANPGIRGQ
ncbi:hypothetical protein F2Q69_00036257 [Brassica cretica]|uniref:Uncharacterized protein n=1 Tax=Brassica cretica TaxID=69181 RepID=A0A8S9SS43_BRACR|nr:hypothetical protein F2Q69_00036257 [Brassica cretica]